VSTDQVLTPQQVVDAQVLLAEACNGWPTPNRYTAALTALVEHIRKQGEEAARVGELEAALLDIERVTVEPVDNRGYTHRLALAHVRARAVLAGTQDGEQGET